MIEQAMIEQASFEHCTLKLGDLPPGTLDCAPDAQARRPSA
ncbi:MAG TPA: hypothetical protein VJY33_01010 [Isosphaeraceae bacterium]|nr:hypothetical protein [Isosphaeraceae bacterium]